MSEFINAPIAAGVISGVLSGLAVALIVARVRLFRPPDSLANSVSAPRVPVGERITVRISIRQTEPPRTESDRVDSDNDDHLIIWVAGVAIATGFFATYVDLLTSVLLLISSLLGATFVTAIGLLLIYRVRLASGSILLMVCGMTGSIVGVVSAMSVGAESVGLADRKSLDDLFGLAYLMLGWAVAMLLVAVSLWGLSVLLATVATELNAPGHRVWAVVTRTAAPLWWYGLVAVVFGAASVALSTGWAFELVGDNTLFSDA